MSWTWRTPRVPVQPNHGWRGPHQLVDDYAKRGVEIAKLNGILIQTEHNLAASRAEVRNLNAHVLDLHGRIECQADRIEAERAEWETAKRHLKKQHGDAMARITELERTIVAMFEQVPGLDEHFDRIAGIVASASTNDGRTP